MKRIYFILFSILLLTSCGKANEKHLTTEYYGQVFKEKNSILFLNDSCEHSLVCEGAGAFLEPWEAAQYHRTYCKLGGCDYEPVYEPHTLVFKEEEIPQSLAKYAENGYLYHSFAVICDDCYSRVTVTVLCDVQDSSCGKGNGALNGPAECLKNCDWQELFKDTPYRIIVKKGGEN